MEDHLYPQDAPLQAYLALAEKYYTQDRLDLAMRVVQDAFTHEGWEPGLWTAFFNELQCEYDARMGSALYRMNEKLSLEIPRAVPVNTVGTLERVALDSLERVRDVLGAEFERPVMVTVFLPDAPVDFIVGTYGYVMHKTELDKVCLPFDILQSGETREALVHEFTHVAVHEIAGPELPSWLDEGVAEYVGGMPPEELIRKSAESYPRMLSLGRLESALDDADLRKDDIEQVNTAYNLAASFIGWWVKQFGLPTLRQAFHNINQGQKVDRAIGHATGHSLRSMERDWRRWLQSSL